MRKLAVIINHFWNDVPQFFDSLFYDFSKKKIVSAKKFQCFEKQHNFKEILPTRCHFTAIDLVNCLKYERQKKSVLGHLRSVSFGC